MEHSAPRSSRPALSTEAFDRLLGWLDSDRDQAGQRYEQIRLSLTRIFISRGCLRSEELADETIDRVAMRLPEFQHSYQGDPALYFYGVAKKIYLEQTRPRSLVFIPPRHVPDEQGERRLDCLDRCLERMTQKNRELIISYYGHEANSEQRKSIARQLEMDANALWVRVHRLRKKLQECVTLCLDGPVPS